MTNGCPRCKLTHGPHGWYYCQSCMDKGAPKVLGRRVDYYRKKYGKNWWRILVKRQSKIKGTTK